MENVPENASILVHFLGGMPPPRPHPGGIDPLAPNLLLDGHSQNPSQTLACPGPGSREKNKISLKHQTQNTMQPHQVDSST